MKLHHVATALLVVLGLALTARAEDKKDVDLKKLLGKWVCTESKSIEGATVEFLKDRKGAIVHKQDGKDVTFDFTYAIDGNVVKVTPKGQEGKEKTDSYKITKLTDKEMVAEGDNGEVHKFTKK